MEQALDAGAEDVAREDERFVVTTDAERVSRRAGRAEGEGVAIAEAELAMVPKNTVQIEGKDARRCSSCIEAIEDLDDVQKVWANFDIDDAELAKVEG